MLINFYRVQFLFGLVMGALLLIFLSEKDETTNFEELALGKGTISVFPKPNEKQVHCSDLENFNNCYSEFEKSKLSDNVILWLGNSQLHSINDWQPNQETAPVELHNKFEQHGYHYLTLSQPNANLQEHYVLFAYALSKLPIKILVLPIVFDDMREEGIRPNISSALSNPATSNIIEKSDIGDRILTNYLKNPDVGDDNFGIHGTVQQKVEEVLNDFLASKSQIWAKRPELRGELIYKIYTFRNWLFNIQASSVRKIIPGRYVSNTAAFVAMLELAKMQNIDVLVYIAPLRSDVNIPYDPEEYSAFKFEFENLTLQNDGHFLDLGELVPGKFWGEKQSTSNSSVTELDYMHFRAEGHRLLADAVYLNLTEMLKP